MIASRLMARLVLSLRHAIVAISSFHGSLLSASMTERKAKSKGNANKQQFDQWSPFKP